MAGSKARTPSYASGRTSTLDEVNRRILHTLAEDPRMPTSELARRVGLSAWVRIRPGPGQLSRIADLAARTPEVSECHRISGEDCFLMKVHAATIADLEPLLDRFLAHGHTTSSFVVSTPVPSRPVLP
jgi:Lrp/AsnC family leucine-responsive transcriptional regulator